MKDGSWERVNRAFMLLSLAILADEEVMGDNNDWIEALLTMEDQYMMQRLMRVTNG